MTSINEIAKRASMSNDGLSPGGTAGTPRADVAQLPGPQSKTSQPRNAFCYFLPQARSHRVIFLRALRFERFTTGVLSTVPDSAGPLDQSEGMARESTELPRIGLAGRVPQCIDSSPAKRLRILWFLETTEVGHRSWSRDRCNIGKRCSGARLKRLAVLISDPC